MLAGDAQGVPCAGLRVRRDAERAGAGQRIGRPDPRRRQHADRYRRVQPGRALVGLVGRVGRPVGRPAHPVADEPVRRGRRDRPLRRRRFTHILCRRGCAGGQAAVRVATRGR
jgi:hypothetical protein